jgi:uncharacterized ubiquitin-like protein YukD
MADIEIVITDATGARSDDVVVPNDAPSARIIAKLVEVLSLPLTAPDGQPMSYKFHHMQSSRQVRDEQSLADAGVSSGDTVRLVPEITAGSA